MKKIFSLLALIVITTINAQAPQGFNYQATVRNSAGALIINQNVYFKFNIMLNSATSVPVFSEIHYVATDDLGQVNLIIGTGTATTGTFSTINWGTGNYFLGIELNTGTSYVAMGTTQLLSVPYALYANTAGNSQAVTPNLADVLAVNNGANNLQIKNLADPTDAKDAVTKSYVDVLQTQIANLQSQITTLQNSINPPPPVSNGVLVKTRTTNDGNDVNVFTLTYNGNKVESYNDSSGQNGTITYSGDLIIREENNNTIGVMNYSNNLLISKNYNYSYTNYNYTENSNYTYNLDGSITEDKIYTDTSSGSTYQNTQKTIRFFSQGNCIRTENYSLINGVFTLNSTIIYTYDTNNNPYNNIIGFYAWQKPGGASINNEISAITQNASGDITETSQTTYQYNSQNYPISTTVTYTPYTIDPTGGTSSPGTPTILTNFFTYY
jgi:hypothetical protein